MKNKVLVLFTINHFISLTQNKQFGVGVLVVPSKSWAWSTHTPFCTSVCTFLSTSRTFIEMKGIRTVYSAEFPGNLDQSF